MPHLMTTRPAARRATLDPDRHRTGIALAGLATVLSGVAVLVNGTAVRAVGDPTLYTTLKNAVAAVVLVSVLGVRSARRGDGAARGLLPDRPWRLLPLALIGGSVPFVLFFEGLARTRSTDAAFIHKTLVVWVALLAWPLLRERVRPYHLVAIGLSLLGLVLLGGGVPRLVVGGGEAMVLAATLLWSVEVVVARRLLVDVDPLVAGVVRLGGGVLLLVAWVAASGGARPVTVGALWWVLLTGVLLAGFVGCWYAALARAPALDVTAVLVGAAAITAVLDAGPVLPAIDLAGVLGLAAGAAVLVTGSRAAVRT